jgi:predicted Zn-dependent peptidase
MIIDRNTPPPVRPIEQIPISALETCRLPNRIPVHYLNMGEQDVSRIDIMVNAGKWQQPKPLISSFTNHLLKEGAGKLNAEQLAEQLDFYGAWLQLSESHHYSYMTLYTLNKHFRETVALLSDMFREPHFQEEAFHTLLEYRKQQFLINNDKVQMLVYKAFTETLFGKEHPYGQSAVWEDYDRITIDDLQTFHRTHYRPDNIRIILSGKIADAQLKTIEEYFGASNPSPRPSPAPETPYLTPTEPPAGRVCIPKDNALQNAIRMGFHTINRSHADFPGLRVVNTILGGYFGSRLMSNIREEKGYTYGISSGIKTYKHAAFLSIATQTAPKHTENLIAEVRKEIDRLQNETIDRQELETVRNYMLGDFCRSLDGTFSLIEAHISLLASDMDIDFFRRQIEKVKSITPEEVQALAQRYLTTGAMIETVAGKC